MWEFLFKKHSPNYLSIIFTTLVLAPLVAWAIFWIFKVFHQMTDLNALPSIGLISFSTEFYYWFGAPISVIAGFVVIIALYFKKSLSTFSVSMIGGLIAPLWLFPFAPSSLVQILSYYFSPFNIVFFVIGFFSAMVCYRVAIKYHQDETEVVEKKRLFEQRAPAYSSLFIVALMLGPVIVAGIYILLAIVFRISEFSLGLIILVVLSAVMTCLITIIILFFKKTISAFSVGIIGGGSFVLLQLLFQNNMGMQTGVEQVPYFVQHFFIGFVSAVLCFLLVPEPEKEMLVSN